MAQVSVTVPQIAPTVLVPAVENVSRAVGEWGTELGKAGTEAVRSLFASESPGSDESEKQDYERLGQLFFNEAAPSEINGLTEEILQKRVLSNKGLEQSLKRLELERDRYIRKSGKLSVALAANHVFRKGSQRLLGAQIEEQQKYVDDSLRQLLSPSLNAPSRNRPSFEQDPFFNVDALVRGLEQLTKSERMYEFHFGDGPNSSTKGSARALKRMLTEIPVAYQEFLERTFRRMKEYYPEGKNQLQGPGDKESILALGQKFWEQFSNQVPSDFSNATQLALDLYAHGPHVAAVLKEELESSDVSLDWGALNLKTFQQGLSLMPLWVALTTPLTVMRDEAAADSKMLLDSPTVESDIPLSHFWYRIKELEDAENVYTRTFFRSPYSDRPNEVAQVIANNFFDRYPKIFQDQTKTLFQKVTALPPFTPKDDSMAFAGLAIHALTVRLLKQFPQKKFVDDNISEKVASDLVGFGPLLPRALEHETSVFKEHSARFEQKPSEKLDHQMSLLALELAAQRYKELQSMSAERGDA